jgi:hypothetical protein
MGDYLLKNYVFATKMGICDIVLDAKWLEY